MTANRGKVDTPFKKFNTGNKQQQPGRKTLASVQCVSVYAVVVSSFLEFLKRSRISFAYLSILIPGLVFAQAQMSTPGSFSVSPSGAANYTTPIQISPGTGGMQPDLALGYSSQGSNGSLGIGWTLAGLFVIHR